MPFAIPAKDATAEQTFMSLAQAVAAALWRKTPAYQEWRKKTDALMSKAAPDVQPKE